MRILSIDGGGFLGLATAAFLEETELHFKTHCRDRFDMFCGTSTGAIIALAFASGMAAQEVRQLYSNLGQKVFPLTAWDTLSRWSVLLQVLIKLPILVRSKHSNAELKRVLADAFGDTTLGDIKERGKLVLVPAFNVSTGAPRVFKTDHSGRLSTDDDYFVRDVALASASAPLYFPPARVQLRSSGVEELFCDGGVVANSPALLGYLEAVGELNVQPNEVRILSLSTPRRDLAKRPTRDAGVRRGGALGWGDTLGSMLIDGPSMISHHALVRAIRPHASGGAIYQRILLSNPGSLRMDDTREVARQELIHVGITEARRAERRQECEPFFNGAG